MEVARQDETFVRELLGRVLHLLYKTLQERGSQMPSLVKDLGLPAGTELPVSFPASWRAWQLFSPPHILMLHCAAASGCLCVL